MNFWVLLAIIAQFIAAVVFMIDKYLMSPKAIGRPIIYAIYASLLSGAVVVLAPIGVISLPSGFVLLMIIITGAIYIVSLLLLYSSLKIADVSDVAPVMGAITAIATLIFGFFLLKDNLPQNFFAGFPLLVLGTFLMSRFRFNKKTLIFVLSGGILFGLSSVLIKIIFQHAGFIDGFFWSRMANVFWAVALLAWPSNFRAVRDSLKKSTAGTKYLVIGNKTLAGFSFLLTLIAINLGSVSVVNSLAGFQFVFILVFAFVATFYLPEYFHEAVHRGHNRLKKITASAIIVVGFIIMFL